MGRRESHHGSKTTAAVAHAKLRKRRNREERDREDAAAAQAKGITVAALRQKRIDEWAALGAERLYREQEAIRAARARENEYRHHR